MLSALQALQRAAVAAPNGSVRFCADSSKKLAHAFGTQQAAT